MYIENRNLKKKNNKKLTTKLKKEGNIIKKLSTKYINNVRLLKPDRQYNNPRKSYTISTLILRIFIK